jgi:hypothetical protein
MLPLFLLVVGFRLQCCASSVICCFSDLLQVEVFCYALSPSDGSEWRLRIEAEAEHFLDVSAWAVPDIARKISADGIHVAVNLNGYTKGARNEIFALHPAPVQTSYMGFPATTGELLLLPGPAASALQAAMYDAYLLDAMLHPTLINVGL